MFLNPRPDRDPAHTILEQVAARKAVSQRTLARDAGIALGLANLLIRRMVREGWVRTVPVRANRLQYVITPAGRAESARRARAHLASRVDSYAQVRGRIAERLAVLSATWPADREQAGGKRVVFYGAGHVAEIGYVCLRESDLQLVGVVDAGAPRPFFDLPVSPLDALAPGQLGSVRFGMLAVMSFNDDAAIRKRLTELEYPPAGVFWI